MIDENENEKPSLLKSLSKILGEIDNCFFTLDSQIESNKAELASIIREPKRRHRRTKAQITEEQRVLESAKKQLLAESHNLPTQKQFSKKIEVIENVKDKGKQKQEQKSADTATDTATDTDTARKIGD